MFSGRGPEEDCGKPRRRGGSGVERRRGDRRTLGAAPRAQSGAVLVTLAFSSHARR